MIWSPCIELPGYFVSNAGFVRGKSGRILRGVTFSNGYKGIRAVRGGKTHLVHRLVLRAFVGPAKEGETANHKNGVRLDNRVENLEWVSHSENLKHAHRMVTRKPHARTTAVRLANGTGALSFSSTSDAARFLKVNQGSVHSALTRKHRCRGYVVEAA
jgi:hypothetical protein